MGQRAKGKELGVGSSEFGVRSWGYVELPYTLPQDFTLFVLMRETTIDIWKRKLDWVAEHGGMALVNTHPDYMHFGELATDAHGRTRMVFGKVGREEYPVTFYEQLLEYIRAKYDGQYWHVLPREMAGLWRSRAEGLGQRAQG